MVERLGGVGFEPEEAKEGVLAHDLLTGDPKEVGRRDIVVNPVGDINRAGALPGDDGIEQATVFIHGGAVIRKGGDDDRPYRVFSYRGRRLPPAVDQLSPDGVDIPDEPVLARFLAYRRVGQRLPVDDIAPLVNRNRADVCGAAVKNEHELLHKRPLILSMQ